MGSGYEPHAIRSGHRRLLLHLRRLEFQPGRPAPPRGDPRGLLALLGSIELSPDDLATIDAVLA